MFTIDRPRYRKRTNRRTLRLETIESRIVPAFAVGVNVDGFVTDLLPPLGSSGAVGLNHYVQFANGVFTVLNKASGSQALQMDDATFWNNAGISASITGVGLAQPRVIYDALSQHWFAVEINLANTGNLVLLARSNTSDPTGPWQAISYTAVSATRFGNFPTLAVDKNGVYIGTGNFTDGSASASPVSSTMTSFPKTGLINLDTTIAANVTAYLATRTSLTQTSPVAMGWSPQPVTNFDNADDTASVVATHYSTFDLVTYWEITGSSGSGATFGTPVNRAIPHNALPANARQPDGTRDMSGGDDDRYTSAIYQVGDLIYAVHPISVNGSGVGTDYDPFFNPNTTDALQLLVIRDSTNTVVANATYYSPNYDYTFGSVAANQYGDIVIGFNRSGGLGSVQGNLGAYAVHAKINPANPTTITFLEQVELKAGLATSYNLTGTVVEPWGPYSATSPDPSNPFAFWTTQQYVAAADTWGTRVAQLFVSPSAQSVTSSAANIEYGLGQQIPITVTFNGAVKVTGTPRLLLNSGGIAHYSSGTGTNELTFLYTVGAGEISADLDYTSTAALQLNGGTINLDVSTAAVPADLVLPSPGAAGSLGFNKNISVNAVVPVVTSVTTPAVDGTYMYGQVISITINFDRDAVVVGVPQLALNSGGIAFYNSGSTTSSLTFLYTVGAGESSSDLDYQSSAALTLPGGATIKDEITGGNAVLTLPTPGQTGSISDDQTIVIDALPPAVTGVTSSAADGTYNFGAVIPIEVSFNKNVQVTGSPRLLLNTGGMANYFSTSGSVVTFHYTVGAGESTLDLNYTATTALQLNGGTIIDVLSPQSANLTLPAPAGAGSLGTNKNIAIDTLPPKVTGVTSPLTNGTYHFGQLIPIEITFDKAVQVSGPAPSLTLNNGGVATYFSTNGNVLTFHYTVGAGQSTPDLNYASTSALVLNGGTITEVSSGQNANLTLPSPSGAGSLGTNKDIEIVTSEAHVTDVTATNANGTYIVGAIIDIQVTFDQSVVVGGTPRLNLNSGGFADYVSGSGSATLLFRYTVSAGQFAADLDYTNVTALDLNGGSIQATGQDAILILPTPGTTGSLGLNKNIVIDAIAPQLLEFRVLFGSKSYNLLNSTRTVLPWRITGIQAVFSEPIVTGSRLSLGGLSATTFVGKGTNTLTWKFLAKVKGTFNATLANSGIHALKDSSGNPIAAFAKAFQVLYGDVDDNGIVNFADETLVRQSLAKPYQPSSTNYNIFADVSGDGIVNLIDVTTVRSRRGQTL